MKLMKLTTEDGIVVGIVHEFGRVERILVATDPEQSTGYVDRIVNAVNACEGLSDVSLRQLAEGTATAGDLPERVLAMSFLYANNKRLAERFLAQARTEIQKRGGKA